MLYIEHSVITSDAIKRFDCSVKLGNNWISLRLSPCYNWVILKFSPDGYWITLRNIPDNNWVI